MKNQLSFSKNTTLQNLLFDEYFAEYQRIEVIAFNFDATGAALCRCDGKLAEINAAHLKRILFGAERESLETFLHGVFDPETEAEDLQRQEDDRPVFRLAALQAMKKYDIANLAKKTMKEVHAQEATPFRYFTQDEAGQ